MKLYSNFYSTFLITTISRDAPDIYIAHSLQVSWSHMGFTQIRVKLVLFPKKVFFKKISEIHFWSDWKIVNIYKFMVLKSIDNSNLKILPWIIKKFKILTIFKNFLKNFETLFQNFDQRVFWSYKDLPILKISKP